MVTAIKKSIWVKSMDCLEIIGGVMMIRVRLDIKVRVLPVDEAYYIVFYSQPKEPGIAALYLSQAITFRRN